MEKVRFQGPPYTNSTVLLGFLREETPPQYQYLLEDLFETITLYDNRAVSARMKRSPSGESLDAGRSSLRGEEGPRTEP